MKIFFVLAYYKKNGLSWILFQEARSTGGSYPPLQFKQYWDYGVVLGEAGMNFFLISKLVALAPFYFCLARWEAGGQTNTCYKDVAEN